jgi:hypothetical protein
LNEFNEGIIENFFFLTSEKNSSAIKVDTMAWWYQRRTQKGIGRTQKTMHSGIAKNPRLLKACNITLSIGDMGEFFFIFLNMRMG